jgi:hypothetical protein
VDVFHAGDTEITGDEAKRHIRQSLLDLLNAD